MYLCVCNAITNDQVAWAVEARGAATVEEVFGALGAQPDCQRCTGFLEEAVLRIRAGERVAVGPAPLGATPWGCPGRCRPSWGAETRVA